ncbi:hypothetical protein [Sphingomonas sp.]|uniref:hypothetical protein n=1 Tax=Sphingomonas sp. TaxID=28214 RepID=UPI0031E308F9
MTAISLRDERRRDWFAAIALALLLTACWVARDWAQLRWFNLPDTDDMMRLAQVRDWVAGQGFNDWTQYRLAPPEGAPMHWSRINDLGPAAMLVTLTPLIGRHAAELTMVIGYPALLFVVCLFLSARLARRLGGAPAALPAILIAALAYPANALFLPGRIDHHALQIVLLQLAAFAVMGPGGRRSGALLGGAIALSFGVGLETAPQALVLVGVLFVRWVVLGAGERARALGFGGALFGVTLLLVAVARPSYWTAQWCDGFTPASVAAALGAGAAWLAIGMASPWLRDWRLRLVAGGVLGGAAVVATLLAYPACLGGPYGPMGPFLRRAIIDSIPEATGLFAQPSAAAAVQAVALLAVAAGASLLYLRGADADRRWAALPLALIYAISIALTVSQLRGAYMGAAMAAPMLAQLVLAAREAPRWRSAATLGAWCASAGVLWLVVSTEVEGRLRPAVSQSREAAKSCRDGDVWHQLDASPPGTILTAMNHGARVIGGSHHGSVGAGYHRNNRGNRATYDFFLAAPERAREIAAAWQARYMLFCPGDFEEIGVSRDYPASLAAQLNRGAPPPWAERIPLRDTGLQFYRIR